MKRVQLIETGIIAVVLVLLYQFTISFIALIAGIFFLVYNHMPGTGSSITFDLIFPIVLYLCSIYLLIMYKKPLARLLNGKEADETHLPINFSSRQLLHTAIIIICLITFITEISVIIYWLIESFIKKPTTDKTENDFTIDQRIQSTNVYVAIIKSILTVVFALLAKKISNFWSNKQDNPAN
jgi:hypothetical protein